MKQYSIIGLSLLLIFGTVSCDDWLNLKPENEIVLDDFWKTKTDVESVLSACYRSLSEREIIERMIVWGELRSDNIVEGRDIPSNNNMYDMYRILDGNLTAHNSYATWSGFYSTINICNTLLHYAPQVIQEDLNFTRQDLNLVIGEATTLRALAYFYLVRAFRDVPWVTEPSINDSQNYTSPQASEEEILIHIIDDLETALSNNWLRDSYGNKDFNKGRITKTTVYALLADIYLWKGDYENCIKACSRVLADANLKLITDKEQMYAQIFYRGNSTESIFEIQFNENDMKNSAVTDLYSSNENNMGYYAFPPALGYDIKTNYTGAFSPFNYKVNSGKESINDIRAWTFIRYQGADLFSIFKYGGTNVYRKEDNTGFDYRYRSATSNWIVYRLSDIMLLKAEALVQRGSDSDWEEAFSLVNTVYQRSNSADNALDASNYISKNEREELIQRERQRELLFEGKRWFDLVRMARRENSVVNLNRFVTVKSEDSMAPLGAMVMDAMYMPVSKAELDANRNLKQNPYYEESEAKE